MDTPKIAMGPCPCLASLCHITEKKEKKDERDVRELPNPCRQHFPGLLRGGGLDNRKH